ncbi:TetR/AcrR family transcriptional regulator [Vogesella facilis]|uniref:TetR/AcrR family transcriptional regulator n=1 Tax=Vogesella facilis TaxID=1655232 RepID=A0ABV7RDZ0_9NEIS
MTDAKPTRSEEKRRAILDAARRAFRENGVQATSMDALAAMAEVSKRTVYNHFKSKEALVAYLIAELWQRSMQQIEVRYDAQAPLDAQLREVVEAEIEVICNPEYLELARIALGHFFYHPEALTDAMAVMAAQETAVSRWLGVARGDTRLREFEQEIASEQLHSLIKGSCFWPQLLQMAPPLDADARRALAARSVAMFLDHYTR